MKIFKWKSFFITSLICLLPIMFGLYLWEKLPDTIAIHFNIYGEPDNYSSKGFVVFGLPLIMVLVQAVICFVYDVDYRKYTEHKNTETVIKLLIPVITAVLQVITLGYALGWNIDMRKSISFVVGCIFLVLGKYIPGFDHVKNFRVDAEKARKINRFIGYETVALGLLFLISAFLPAIASIICLFLLIPYTIISIVYTIIAVKK